MVPPKGLGPRGFDTITPKGLGAYFGEEVVPTTIAPTTGPQKVPIDAVFPNRSQPRADFSEEALKDLAASISKDGVLQPLVVAPASEGRFELIAGERRWRASKLAGLKEVPVIIRSVTDEERLELALIENVQREDLNPMEEARAFQQLTDEFQLQAADIAERVGKSREHVANTLRLLKLPTLLQEDIRTGKLTAGHARCLLALPHLEEQLRMREVILAAQLSVRDVEKMIQERTGVVRKKHVRLKKSLPAQVKLVLDEMQQALGTKVRIQSVGVQEGRGQLVIEFFSYQDLDRVYRKIVHR